MKWREIERIARSKGWYPVRHGSKHDIYENPDFDYPIQIERYWSAEVKPGLLKRIMKQINGNK